jgi:hypothetical protein
MTDPVSSTVYVMRHRGLDPLPCYFNLQQVGAKTPFLTFDLEDCPGPLLLMARDGDRGKHPWSEGSSHNGRQLPSH